MDFLKNLRVTLWSWGEAQYIGTTPKEIVCFGSFSDNKAASFLDFVRSRTGSTTLDWVFGSLLDGF